MGADLDVITWKILEIAGITNDSLHSETVDYV